MPIWKVSHTEGTFQVADADGVLYPLTMEGQPLTRFNEGWSPRGLQTGLPPFHVLELEYTGGDTAIWLHDETLDYRANAVLGLSPSDQSRYFAVLDPVIRTLFEECVLAPQAAIPFVAHQFDGMLPRTVQLLTADSIRRTMPGTDLVVLDRLQDLNAGYGNGSDALAPDWIARAIDAPSSAAQERFDLPGRRCDRHLDPNTGLVFFVMRSEDPSETSLFVPQRKVLFVRSRHTHDPLSLLLNYYASHTDRAVILPEASDLAPEMVVPPQHGLDEPPSQSEPWPEQPAATAPAELHTELSAEPPVQPPIQPPVQPPAPVEPHGPDHEQGRTVFEAPLGETPSDQHAFAHDNGVEPRASFDQDQPVPGAAWRNGSVAQGELPPLVRPVSPGAISSGATPKQNWWQRLLGLGNP